MLVFRFLGRPKGVQEWWVNNCGSYGLIMSLFGEYPCTNVTPPTVLSYTTASISIFVSIVATLGNSLVLLAILVDPNKNLRSPFNYFVANLALADVLVGLVVAPLSAVFHVSEGLKTSLHLHIHNYLYLSYFIACTASLLSLIILAVDRYAAIKFPLLYVARLDAFRAVMILACAWIISTVLSLIYFKVGLNIYRFVFANTTIVVTFVVLLFTHAKIVSSFRAQVRKWDDLHDSSSENFAKRQALLWEKKMAKALVIVLGIFLACFLPSCVCIYIINLCSTCNCVFIHCIRDAQLLLVMANSGVNPFVYPWRMQHFREAFKTILSCGKFKGGLGRLGETSVTRVTTLTTDVH